MQKKLLQLNVTANWGSTGKIAEGIGAMAIRNGWSSTIAYGRYGNPSVNNLLKVGNIVDVYRHYINSRLCDKEGLGSSYPTKKLIAAIRDIQPDIFHFHNIHDHWLNYPLLFEYIINTGKPVVWTFHDCWAFTGGCPHFENVGCFKWRDYGCAGICPAHHNRAKTNFSLRQDIFSQLGSRLNIVCVSEWLANYCVEKTEHAGTASGVEKCLKMAIGLKNTAIDYQIVAF